MSKILVTADEEGIRKLVRVYLENAGHDVLEATDGEDALKKIELHKPDLLLLDMVLPSLDGLEVCKLVRRHHDLPIIMATVHNEGDAGIRGLEMGADDYITKPFNYRELLARIKAVLRRYAVQEKVAFYHKAKVELTGLSIDMESKKVVSFGRSMQLTARELALLWHLVTNPNKAFSREQLLEAIGGSSACCATRTVDTHIKHLRHKLSMHHENGWDIETVWGFGYKFMVEES